MPLLDHFRPPLSRTHPWRGFHGAWAAAIARLLNEGVLPVGYYAVPFLDREGPIEIDVATLKSLEGTRPGDGSAATASWSPAAPGLAVAVEWGSFDDVRVEVFADDGDPRLAAAIELVSPRNKDRASAREAFAAKCADYLRRGCGLAVVDVVTTRRADLHADLFAALGVDESTPLLGSLRAVAYRPALLDGEGRLWIWPAPLELGQSLPTLPLWLDAESAVPLDLEASYTAACRDLRIAIASADGSARGE